MGKQEQSIPVIIHLTSQAAKQVIGSGPLVERFFINVTRFNCCMECHCNFTFKQILDVDRKHSAPTNSPLEYWGSNASRPSRTGMRSRVGLKTGSSLDDASTASTRRLGSLHRIDGSLYGKLALMLKLDDSTTENAVFPVQGQIIEKTQK